MRLNISTDTPYCVPRASYTDMQFSYLLGGANSNAKTAKGIPIFPDIEAAIMYLAPATLADGVHSLCPWSTAGCRASCLFTSGRGQITGPLELSNLLGYGIHRARLARAQLYLRDRQLFIDMVADELRRLQNRADRRGKRAVVRLNGTSDIAWESVASEFFCTFPRMQFYDYTKGFIRATRFAAGELPANYHLTYSRGEATSDASIVQLASQGVNTAVVFRERLPCRFTGYRVIDGNRHDFRAEDPKGVIVGLTEKARARSDSSGFVVEVADPRIRNCWPAALGHSAGCAYV